MIKSYRSIIGSPIIQYDNGNLLGIIQNIIIDSDTGKVEAFWVKPATLPIYNAVIQTQDIIEFKKNIYIKDDSVIADPADIIKISELLTKNILILNNRVKNEAGRLYGRVYDLDFDTEHYYLKNIATQKNILGLIAYKHRIFSFDSIIEILPDFILIKDDSTKKEIAKGIVKDQPADAMG